MGLKDKIFKDKKSQHGKTTRGFSLGVPEAEGENQSGKLGFLNYFSDYLHIVDQINNGKFIIIGRKGSGKSAIVKYIMELSENKEEHMESCLIAPYESNLEKLIQSIPDDIAPKEDIIFEWLIQTRLVKELLNANRATYSNGIKALNQFYKKNSGIIDIDQLMVLERAEDQQNQVNITPLNFFSVIIGKSFKAKEVRAPFYRLIPSLRDILKEVLSYDDFKGFEFYIMFDDLDINFKLSNKKDKEKLLSLIRVARNYNNIYLKDLNAKVLLFLRDDISERLDGVNSDKTKMLSSYSARLYWYEHNVAKNNETKIMLRQLINKRLKANFETFGLPFNEIDPWTSFIEDNRNVYGDRGSFRYILDFTFYRPRDIINIFKDVGDNDYELPLRPGVVKGLLKTYCKVNVGEIKDELSNLYDGMQIEEIFRLLSTIANNPHMNYMDLNNLANSLGLNSNDIGNLVEYSFLIPCDNKGFQYFRYREDAIHSTVDKYQYTLPKCLYGYFRPDLAF